MTNLFPHVLTVDASGAIVGPENVEANGKRVLVAGDPATFSDEQLQAVFQVIDDTQGMIFYMLTDDPGRLEVSWPPRVMYVLDYRCRPTVSSDRHHLNVIIGVPCKTQAEADRLIPELLKLSGLCHGLWVDLRGQTEEIDLRLPWIHHADGTVEKTSAIDFVTIGGIDTPIHPQWLRTIRDQCQAAGVALWFDGWGEHIPASMHESCNTNDRRLVSIEREARHYAAGQSCDSIRVGSARSGHLLDGVEVRETLEGE